MTEEPQDAERRRSTFDPLLYWLQALPANQDHAELSLDAITQLIGEPLPKSASTPAYWASGASTHRRWKSMGFRAHLDRWARVVTFTRVQR
jgi:hypothetical protein